MEMQSAAAANYVRLGSRNVRDRECAELFSLFSSFDGDCQSGSFLIQRNRDKLSTRKFDVGVFTQPGSSTDLTTPKFDFRSSPKSGLKSDIGPCPVRANSGSRRL